MSSTRQHEDSAGKTYGNWLVLELTHGKRGATEYKCECQCSRKTISTIRPLALIKGESVKCKFCLGAANKRNCWKGHGEISGRVWSKIPHGAKSRGIEFNITIEYAWELFLKQNRKCALSGLPLKFPTTAVSFDGTSSLDRIDSTKGYIEGIFNGYTKTYKK